MRVENDLETGGDAEGVMREVVGRRVFGFSMLFLTTSKGDWFDLR
jgi:hypothetical protein